MYESNRVNIFVDCHVFDNGFQGTTTYLTGLYSVLIAQKKHQFFLAGYDIENLKNIFGHAENVTYLKYKSRSKFYRLLIDIPRLISSHRIDFAHFQYIVPPIKRCKYIVTIHDVLFIDFPEYFPLLSRIKNTLLFKWSARLSDVVLTVSEYSKERIEKHFNLKNVQITYNAVADEFFEEYDKESIQLKISERYNLSKYLIYISRWEPRKKHDLVLEAFVELELYKSYTMLFVGDISIPNKRYDQIFKALDKNIKSNIYHFKKVDYNSMLMLLRGSELALYPSVAEGFGIPPLESFAARVPVVTSNLTAMREFDFMSAFSFDPNDKEEFKQVLLKTLTLEPKNVVDTSKIIKKKYNWEKSANSFNFAVQQYNAK